MGKAARWIRGLLGIKKDESPSQTLPESKPAKRRWGHNVKSQRQKDRASPVNAINQTGRNLREAPSRSSDDVDPNKHAIAVAAATAAVAEAAVAAAQAAAEVVRLTSKGNANAAAYVSRGRRGTREDRAAIIIQSHFRAYLSRRALRALKALVKLQALVRGHIVRKQTAEMLRRMQALLRAQVRARSNRTVSTDSPISGAKSSQIFTHGPETPEKFEIDIRTKSIKHDPSFFLKRNGSNSSSRMISDQGNPHNGSRTGPTDDEEKNDKILEIDTGKYNSYSYSTSRDSTTHESPLKFTEFTEDLDEESSFCTADNSPQYYSASSRGGSSWRSPFTPNKSDGGSTSGYSDHPNYMSYTACAKNKMRSLSAPKQRPQFERSSSTKRHSVHGHGESRSSAAVRVSAMQANFANKAYPGSGRLDRLGMPVRGGTAGGDWNRY